VVVADMKAAVAGSPVADMVGLTLYTRELVTGALGVDPAWNNRALGMGVVGTGDSPVHNLKFILYENYRL